MSRETENPTPPKREAPPTTELAAVFDRNVPERNDRFHGLRAIVYSGPRYGRVHIIERVNCRSGLVWVRCCGDRFAAPYVDVELIGGHQ